MKIIATPVVNKSLMKNVKVDFTMK